MCRNGCSTKKGQQPYHVVPSWMLQYEHFSSHPRGVISPRHVDWRASQIPGILFPTLSHTPGIALVMPTAPGADGLAGKEVCVCMHKASVAKALMPEMQARIHKFAPAADTTKKGSNTAEEMKDACV
ncbi:hypothetical protein Naga_101605g1 [Nannochloropsis gaditana]|uniref:Uncharacterized protein n=1 Tax=Nannochloropsis gaditana TaxID=72520 RepID=W7TP70_9STRA|nr:hypothetical protein Naga_101605g1 [Nannochloropsis gaditana]